MGKGSKGSKSQLTDVPERSLITPREFCRLAKVSYRTFQRLAQAGLLFGAEKTITGRWRVPVHAVDLYLQGYRPSDDDRTIGGGDPLDGLWIRVTGHRCPARPIPDPAADAKKTNQIYRPPWAEET
jgi:hypothetical protein